MLSQIAQHPGMLTINYSSNNKEEEKKKDGKFHLNINGCLQQVRLTTIKAISAPVDPQTH